MHNRCIVLAKKNANFLKQAHYILLNSLLHKKSYLVNHILPTNPMHIVLIRKSLKNSILFKKFDLLSEPKSESNHEISGLQCCMSTMTHAAPSPHYTYLVLHLQNWQFVSRQVFLWGVLLLLFWEATNISFFQVLTLLKYNEMEKKNSISSCWSHRRWMHSCWKLIKFSL